MFNLVSVHIVKFTRSQELQLVVTRYFKQSLVNIRITVMEAGLVCPVRIHQKASKERVPFRASQNVFTQIQYNTLWWNLFAFMILPINLKHGYRCSTGENV